MPQRGQRPQTGQQTAQPRPQFGQSTTPSRPQSSAEGLSRQVSGLQISSGPSAITPQAPQGAWGKSKTTPQQQQQTTPQPTQFLQQRQEPPTTPRAAPQKISAPQKPPQQQQPEPIPSPSLSRQSSILSEESRPQSVLLSNLQIYIFYFKRKFVDYKFPI